MSSLFQIKTHADANKLTSHINSEAFEIKLFFWNAKKSKHRSSDTALWEHNLWPNSWIETEFKICFAFIIFFYLFIRACVLRDFQNLEWIEVR